VLRLKASRDADDPCTVTTTIPGAETTRLRTHEPVSGPVRRRRQELRAERERCRYLRRLLQARLDLAVAHAVGAHTGPGAADLPAGSPVPPSVAEVTALIEHGRDLDLGTSLPALREALRRLTAYEDALEVACEEATTEVVASLAARHRDLLPA
jgi:hypothetical protein